MLHRSELQPEQRTCLKDFVKSSRMLRIPSTLWSASSVGVLAPGDCCNFDFKKVLNGKGEATLHLNIVLKINQTRDKMILADDGIIRKYFRVLCNLLCVVYRVFSFLRQMKMSSVESCPRRSSATFLQEYGMCIHAAQYRPIGRLTTIEDGFSLNFDPTQIA
ncbi:hypothetical protein M413DRAFT_445569 [Hebeloma cylindrosporum]|uniref:Uncharacterized protein n=1 Tax=Hebeloma cylindrosporum TaxID=76867 RepID=A0A0C2XVE9_HEBCY|nr:hypothetical protein M413DRAFT_445569 [Hebeloma cylindrosporum h7]